MTRIEHLLAALSERERLLREARTAERHAGTVMQAMDLIYGCDDIESGIAQALQLCEAATGAELWLLLRRAEGMVTTLASGDAGAGGSSWPDGADYLARPRRVTDLRQLPWAEGLREALRAFRSLLSVPLDLPGEPPMAIVLLSRGEAAFSRFDQRLLDRIGALLGQAIDKRRLADRNSVLAGILGGGQGAARPGPGFFDASFEALSRAYASVAEWQGNIVEITNALLVAPSSAAGGAIDDALARTGMLARSDRTYVFRARPPDRLDNTHEWVAPGIAPMISRLQDLPDTLLDEWRDSLAAGRAISIPDVEALPEGSDVRDLLRVQGIRSLLAVPMLRDGEIAGFMGFDAVHAPRHFLPVEIQLLQAVANAVHVVLERATAEATAETARAGLEAERNRLKATLAAIPDLVLELDREGRFVAHVAGAGLRAAVTPGRFLGRMPEEVLPANVAGLARHVMAIVDREGRSEGHEYRLDIDGKPQWFMLSAAAKVIRGEPAGYVFAIRDITARVLEGQQLQRLGKIAELTSNLVVITDAEQRIEWVNPAFERLTGWRLEEIRGRRPDSFLVAEKTRQSELRRIGAALREGRPVQAELLNRTRTGEEYWISKDIQPLLSASGEVEGFVAVQTDITSLKHSHKKALADRAAALDASGDGIAITDAEGRYTYMNTAHRRMFGIGEREDIRRYSWQDLVPPPVREQFMAEEWHRFEATGAWRGELPGLHRDGSRVQQEVSLTLRENGILCITRDISERLKLETERARLREELQLAHRRETIAHLASGVAHDLNNLVAVVAGSASLLGERCTDDAEAMAGVERILRATETARDLVGGLGDLGRPKATRAIQDLRRLIAEGVDLLGSRRIREHAVSAELPDRPCPVWANVTELLQVIVNLALNACEASGDRPNRVSLAVAADSRPPARAPDAGMLCPDGSYTLFTVSDTGTGIDEETRARLFERYFTTKGISGSGLGLPIVAAILRDNEAALWIDSRPGHGTTFTIAWPAEPRAVSAQGVPARKPGTPSDLTGRHVLVVDDLPDVADVLAEMLENAGAIAVAVSDPCEAAELLRDNPGLWSALVTDLDMPRLRGTDLARIAEACTPPVPTLLVTALPEAIGPGAGHLHAVLPKPAEAARLISAVGTALAPSNGE